LRFQIEWIAVIATVSVAAPLLGGIANYLSHPGSSMLESFAGEQPG
jgi:hypothetical protein